MVEYTYDNDHDVYYYLFKDCIPISIILNKREVYGSDIVFTELRTDYISDDKKDEELKTIKLFCTTYNISSNKIYNRQVGFHCIYVDYK